MALALTQSATARAARLTASFLGVGGTEPYVYSVTPGGAGGTIDADTGVYTAPNVVSSDPATLYDTIVVTDDDAATASARILIGTPLLLFCEMIQKELGLADGRVYLWDQKIMQPTDSGLYVAVSVPRCKPFGNVNTSAPTGGGLNQAAFVAMLALLDIDIISRGPAARDRKEEVVLALNSQYSQQQQTANSFFIGTLPASSQFINLSNVDGAAIPYRYRISVNIQYAFSKASPAQFYDDFRNAEVFTDP